MKPLYDLNNPDNSDKKLWPIQKFCQVDYKDHGKEVS